jgi:TDG/mug DNA glycosylase family protein
MQPVTIQAQSFPPLQGAAAHTLILGTMPGQASLLAQQYYAHPRNAFWPVMLAIISNTQPRYDSVQTLAYDKRCQLLTDNGYALWDVLASCRRPGSLDSSIERGTDVPNDIAGLLIRHPDISCIACNGKTAGKLLERHILSSLKQLQQIRPDVRIVSLPSTSPAMAGMSLVAKHKVWSQELHQSSSSG